MKNVPIRHDEDGVTPPEIREMVDMTLDLIHRRVGSIRNIRRPSPSDNVKERIDLIRRRAEAIRREWE